MTFDGTAGSVLVITLYDFTIPGYTIHCGLPTCLSAVWIGMFYFIFSFVNLLNIMQTDRATL